MPGYLLNMNATGKCPHAGSAQPDVGAARLKAGGAAVLTVSTQMMISACSNVVANSPFPCVTGAFIVGATRVKTMGLPVVLADSQTMNVPTAVPTSITNTQTKVKGI